MITYTDHLDDITSSHLKGFFGGWLDPPSPDTHLKLLCRSDPIVLAVDSNSGNVVGYITALTDRVLFAYISSLEVLPAYQHQGIGRELVRQLLEKLRDVYAIDLVCDADVQPFYERCGMSPLQGMCVRHYDRQSGSSIGN